MGTGIQINHDLGLKTNKDEDKGTLYTTVAAVNFESKTTCHSENLNSVEKLVKDYKQLYSNREKNQSGHEILTSAKEGCKQLCSNEEKNQLGHTSGGEDEEKMENSSTIDLETRCTKRIKLSFDKKYLDIEYLISPSDTPIKTPTENDILFGRGGLTNHHAGNKRFRDLVILHKKDYTNAIKVVKPRVARKIVKAIRNANPPGRFLKRYPDGMWRDVGDRHATEKASQALREKSQDEKKATKAKAKVKEALVKGNPPVSVGDFLHCADGTTPVYHSSQGKSCMVPYQYNEMYSVMAPTSIMPNPPHLCHFPYPGMPPKPFSRVQPIENVTMSRENQRLVEIKNHDHRNEGTHLVKGGEKLDKNNITEMKDEDKEKITKEGGEGNSPIYPRQGGIFGKVDDNGNIVVTDQDILCGRGGKTNHHKGNKRFRDVIALHRQDYIRSTKVLKPAVARVIVKKIRSGNPCARFLKKDKLTNNWVDIGDQRATEKASQALREKLIKQVNPSEINALYTNNYLSWIVQHGSPLKYSHEPFDPSKSIAYPHAISSLPQQQIVVTPLIDSSPILVSPSLDSSPIVVGKKLVGSCKQITCDSKKETKTTNSAQNNVKEINTEKVCKIDSKVTLPGNVHKIEV